MKILDSKKLVIAAALVTLFGVGRAEAQSGTVITPDCQIFFNFTAVGNSPTSPSNGLNNRTVGCTTWQISYSNSGFSAISLVLQSAADSNGVPGTYGTFSGTIITGSNPNTGTTEAYTQLTGFNPWVRVRLASATGTGVVSGAAYGWRIPSASNSGTGIGTQDVNLVDVGGAAISLGQKAMANSFPVVIASNQGAVAANVSQVAGVTAASDSSGAAASMCNNPGLVAQANLAITTSGAQLLVTGTSSTRTRICHMWFSTGSPEDLTITDGTGTDCTAGTTHVLSKFYSISGMALDTDAGFMTQTNANNLCVNPSAVQNANVTVVYVKF